MILLLVNAVAGCGETVDDLPRRGISGTITLDGAPMEGGTISFAPDGTPRPNPVTAGAVIRAGEYAIETAKGLTPGDYRVSINSQRKGAGASKAPGPGERKGASKEPIPARYNSSTSLKASVTADGPTKFDYEITSH